MLRRVIDAGGAALEDDRASEVERRRAAWARLSEKYADVYYPGYLAELRRDWPE